MHPPRRLATPSYPHASRPIELHPASICCSRCAEGLRPPEGGGAGAGALVVVVAGGRQRPAAVGHEHGDVGRRGDAQGGGQGRSLGKPLLGRRWRRRTSGGGAAK